MIDISEFIIECGTDEPPGVTYLRMSPHQLFIDLDDLDNNTKNLFSGIDYEKYIGSGILFHEGRTPELIISNLDIYQPFSIAIEKDIEEYMPVVIFNRCLFKKYKPLEPGWIMNNCEFKVK